MPAKTFVAFTRLDASDVNAYLANKSISNAVINGAFDFWQRGTSLTGTGYIADRFATEAVGGTVVTSRQAFIAGAAPVSGYESAFFARLATSGQSAAGDYSIYQQLIEDVRTFAGQTVTLSFFAKASSGTPKIFTEFEQLFGTGGSPSSAVIFAGGQVTLSTSWARYSVTVAIPSLSGKTVGTDANTSALRMRLWLSAGTNFNARTGSLGVQNNTIDIWGVQLEPGTVANDFRRNANSIQGELAACQRYYEKTYPLGTSPGTATSAGFFHQSAGSDANGNIVVAIKLAVAKRVAPTMTAFVANTGASGSWFYGRSGAGATSTVYFDNFSEFSGRAYVPVGASWVVADIQGQWTANSEL